MKRFCAAAGALLLAAALLAHEGHKALEAKGVKVQGMLVILDPRTERAIGVATATARRGTVEDALAVNAAAALAPGARSFASARLAGTVTAVNVAVGARVRAGDVLATVESLELESLALHWRQSEEDLRFAEADLARAKSVTPAVLPEQELDSLQAAVAERRLAAAAARAKLLLVGLTEEGLALVRDGGAPARFLPVTAALDGIVSHVDVAVGEPVLPDRHLFEVDDDREIWVVGSVPEPFAADAATGRETRITFEAVPGKTFTGRITRIAGRIEEASRILRVAVKLEEPGAVRPGTPGRMEIVRRTADAILVPSAAVGGRGLDRYVFVSLGNGRYRRQDVVPGIRRSGEIEIARGLKEGEPVLTDGVHQLSALFATGTLELHAEAWDLWGIRVAEVDLRGVDEVLRLPATLGVPPGASGFASPLVPGKIRRILAFPGDTVAAGAALAEIDSLEMRETQVDLVRSNSRLALLELRAAGLRELEKKGIAARKELLKVESDLRLERLAEQALRARLATAGMSSSDIAGVVADRTPREALLLRAPIAGVIVAADVAVGQVVEPHERLFEIADLARIQAEGALSEADLPRVPSPTGRPVFVRPVAFRGLAWTGAVVVTAPAVGAGNVLSIWGEVANRSGQLLPGMVAEMVLVVSEGKGDRPITAPLESLWPSGGEWFVFLEDGDGFRRQRVVPGRRGSRFAEIRQGLFPGDRVATSGLDALDIAIGSLR
ncbi:MAG: efflux RND transporter periplasmic adaptor subunit [Planctomycetes bacterium]|nr:efflux RND transporter periplasmic adaptor subunit [Planctomycetota bacterium]